MICAAIVYDTPPNKNEINIDEKLISAIANNDREAFGTVYSKCSSSIYAYALSILRNKELAEDAMQETFLRVREAAHLYVPEGKPLAWILTIARNVCLMHFRKMSHISDIPVEDSDAVMGLDEIENAEDRIVLKTAFSILPEDTCQIIMLHAITGLKHREISKILNVPLSTVLSKYNRGLKKLRQELEGKL